MDFYDSLAVTLSILVGMSALAFGASVLQDVKSRQRGLAAAHTVVARQAAAALGGGMMVARGRHGRRRATSSALVAARAINGGADTGRAGQPRQRRVSTIAVAGATISDIPSSLTRMRWGQVMKNLALFWMLCYPGVSVKLFRMFQCIQVEGTWYLAADLRMKCFTPQWGIYAVVAAVMLCVYTIGWPLGMAVWLWRHRRTLRGSETLEKLGFMYEPYGVHAYMWGVVELGRKLALTSLILLFFDTGSALQVTFALLVSAFAHVAHALWRPYVDRRCYLLQHGALGVTTFVYAFGLLFKVKAFVAEAEVGAGDATVAGDRDPAVFVALGVVLVVLCSSWLAWSAVVAVAKVGRTIHEKRKGERRRQLGAGASTRRVSVTDRLRRLKHRVSGVGRGSLAQSSPAAGGPKLGGHSPNPPGPAAAASVGSGMMVNPMLAVRTKMRQRAEAEVGGMDDAAGHTDHGAKGGTDHTMPDVSHTPAAARPAPADSGDGGGAAAATRSPHHLAGIASLSGKTRHGRGRGRGWGRGRGRGRGRSHKNRRRRGPGASAVAGQHRDSTGPGGRGERRRSVFSPLSSASSRSHDTAVGPLASASSHGLAAASSRPGPPLSTATLPRPTAASGHGKAPPTTGSLGGTKHPTVAAATSAATSTSVAATATPGRPPTPSMHGAGGTGAGSSGAPHSRVPASPPAGASTPHRQGGDATPRPTMHLGGRPKRRRRRQPRKSIFS